MSSFLKVTKRQAKGRFLSSNCFQQIKKIFTINCETDFFYLEDREHNHVHVMLFLFFKRKLFSNTTCDHMAAYKLTRHVMSPCPTRGGFDCI